MTVVAHTVSPATATTNKHLLHKTTYTTNKNTDKLSGALQKILHTLHLPRYINNCQ